MAPRQILSCQKLRGTLSLPGDKSLSHRVLFLSSLALGQSRFSNLLESEDITATIRALRQLGVRIGRTGEGSWCVTGQGLGSLRPPSNVLDLGHSGTAARFFPGLLINAPFDVILTGDDSLSTRPMGLVFEPLSKMGLHVRAAPKDTLPALVRGTQSPLPLTVHLPVASAQVKTAILLAGLQTPGETSVIEKTPTRDHTERLLRFLHLPLESRALTHTIRGGETIKAFDLSIPGDPSAAAFLVLAGILCPDSQISLQTILGNPFRLAYIDVLQKMGANIRVTPRDSVGPEPIVDLDVCSSELQGIDIGPAETVQLIDEYPILAIAAACARGVSRFQGLKELRVKESNRLTVVSENLNLLGVKTQVSGDDLIIEGAGQPPPGGQTIKGHGDHRILMSFAILGLASKNGIGLDDDRGIATSFPGFYATLKDLGAECIRLNT